MPRKPPRIDTMENEPHPLFPVEGDAPCPEVGKIYVYRNGVGGPALLQVFEPQEIEVDTQIKDLFGGGTYDIVARSANNARITARNRVRFAGVPAEEAPPAPALPIAQQAVVSHGDDLTKLLLTMLMQLSAQSQSQQVEMTKMMMTMMTAMMSRPADNSANQAWAAMNENTRSMAEKLVDAVREQRPKPGEDQAAAFRRGMELMGEIMKMKGAANGGEEADWGKLFESFIGGLSAIKEVGDAAAGASVLAETAEGLVQ